MDSYSLLFLFVSNIKTWVKDDRYRPENHTCKRTPNPYITDIAYQISAVFLAIKNYRLRAILNLPISPGFAKCVLAIPIISQLD
jgi:hypothetical protein